MPVTKIPVTVRGDPKRCWILEPCFPNCNFFYGKCMLYWGQLRVIVWVINDAEDKMYEPEGTNMGIVQDWIEEEWEREEYSEPVSAVRGVGEGIPERIHEKYV